MIKSAIRRQVFSKRNDVIRCAQLYSVRPISSATSSSSSLTTRRRPRMWQPSLSFEDKYSRMLQSSQFFVADDFNFAAGRQIRALSLSISSHDDSGETNVEDSNSGEINGQEGIHLKSEIDMNGIKTPPIEFSASEINHATDSYDDNSEYDADGGERMPLSIASDNRIDVDRKDASEAVQPLSSLVNPSSVEDRNIDIAGENCEFFKDKQQDACASGERLDHNKDSNDVALSENPDLSIAEEALRLSNKMRPPQKHPLVSRLIKCVHDEDVRTSIKTFNKIMEINRMNARKKEPSIDIPPGLTKALIYMIEPRHPLFLYRIIQYYISLPTSYERSTGGTINEYKKYYRIACDSIRHVDLRMNSKKQIKNFIEVLMTQIGKLDQSGKEMCVPVLLSAICEQPVVTIGNYFAGQIYNYLMKENISVPDGYWLHLLSLSKYSRQDIPYDEILTRAVSLGLRPDPMIVLTVLENFFPFSNVNAVTNMLKAMLMLQRQVVADIKVAKAAAITNETVNPKDVAAKQYFVDIHLLETISAAAASQGHSEINLLIWDMLDVLGYAPSVGIYENTVVAFAMNVFTYREAFTVMYEMETYGYYPTRALIRSVSVHVRDSVRNMDFAQMQVMQLRQENRIKITTSIMNVLMSGAAERGDIDRLLSILKDFERYNIAFDADTISFGFESLGKNLMRRRKFNNTFLDQSRASTRDHIDACMVVANVLLNHMDDHQVKTSDHIIRNYIEFLCLAGHVDTATSIIMEAVHEKGLVSSKSLYRVAMANAKLFRFEAARQVATCDNSIAPLTFLLESIDREEALFNVSLKAKLEQDKKNFALSDFDPLPKDDEQKTHYSNDNDLSNSSTPTSSFWQQ